MGTVDEEQVGLFVELSSRLDPRPVEIPPSFEELVGRPLSRRPRAVLFDVYGTLVISGSGDVGTARTDARGTPFSQAYRIASGVSPHSEAEGLMRRVFSSSIEERHARARERGLPYPEVDIISVWSDVLEALGDAGLEPAPVDIEQLAIIYETLVNPVWPMPEARPTIDRLRNRHVHMGIVSNAQFYTPLLFPALFGASLPHLGFDSRLLSFSSELGRAKPDPLLFDLPLASLRERGIDSAEVLYVGNDMRNDVWCARRAGCMTALYAGDERSCRFREDDPEVADTMPNSVIKSLSEVPVISHMVEDVQ